ncbi:MAG: cryptochrome/photolyase family protein [Burkholderiales bacterium]
MQKNIDSALVWFRRDLRFDDHAALHHACRKAYRVYCVFVLDRSILDQLPRADRRIEFILGSLQCLNLELSQQSPGAGLITVHGLAIEEIPRLAHELKVSAVFANHDDEPASIQRDALVKAALTNLGIEWHSSKDHVIFERSEILTATGRPYSIFTPYKNAWLKKINGLDFRVYPTSPYASALAPRPSHYGRLLELQDIQFESTNLSQLGIQPGSSAGKTLFEEFLQRIDYYQDRRDFPAIKGPSYLSVHLRFGTVSIRHLIAEAWKRAQALQSSAGAGTWLSELIWRDFYHQILHHHPHVAVKSFKAEYDRIQWAQGPETEKLFAAWCSGQTGYPLVDAAMTQLNQTGYMHNRLRMVAASFLVKDLGIDWRWGERYFATQLNDFDLAANNGGWQWAASSGCDAQPYFRIFNPITQSQKFDPEGQFIRRYIPCLAKLPNSAVHAPWRVPPIDLHESGVRLGHNYPLPIVEHDHARLATLARYAVIKEK